MASIKDTTSLLTITRLVTDNKKGAQNEPLFFQSLKMKQPITVVSVERSLDY